MKKYKEARLSLLGLLICAVIGLSMDSCARHRIGEDTTPEEQAEKDSLFVSKMETPEWSDANAFVKAYKVWGEQDSIQHQLYKLSESTLGAVVNVVKKTHAKFTAKDVLDEYIAHKDIYDETTKSEPREPNSQFQADTLEYDTTLNGTKVHVTEYTKIE